MPERSSLNLQDDDVDDGVLVERDTDHIDRGLIAAVMVLIAAVVGLGYFTYRLHLRLQSAERQIAGLTAQTTQAAAAARQAQEKANLADSNARAAAEGRQLAEVEALGARQEADAARQEATTARQEATTAIATAEQIKAEAEKIRKRAEAERDRLEQSLSQIAETRRTALGLVMTLGGDHLKFEFNKAVLSPKDRELLSRIAGILITAPDYTISVNGHTDDVGSTAYNQKLSEKRAQAVRDYFVQAGLSPEILSVTGHGESLPLVRGTSEAARAKNRRVELGIANTQIRYGR
jgi:outer membrane protein OmpA-like peptidoglycan-associated protein